MNESQDKSFKPQRSAKVKRLRTLGSRVSKLREALGQTQAEFAKTLEVTQPMVSAWEGARDSPSAGAYLRLAKLASHPDRLWFLEQAGVDEQLILSAADQLSEERVALPSKGEIVRVPRYRFTEQGRQEAGPPVPFDAEFVPNPRITICVLVDERSTAFVDSPRGNILLDRSCEGAEDLHELWEQVVMLYLAPKDIETIGEQEGIYVGRLHLEGHGSSFGKPESARMKAGLFSLTTPAWALHNLGYYHEPEAMRGLALDDTQGRLLRWPEIRERGRSAFRLPKGTRILGKVVGRLTGHLEASAQGKK